MNTYQYKCRLCHEKFNKPLVKDIIQDRVKRCPFCYNSVHDAIGIDKTEACKMVLQAMDKEEEPNYI